MVSKKLDDHITKSYQRWLDYARYHAKLAHIADQAEDILNTVMMSLLEKTPEKLTALN